MTPHEWVDKVGSCKTKRFELRPLNAGDRAAFIRLQEESEDHFRRWFPPRDAADTLESYFERELQKGENGRRNGIHLRLGAFGHAGDLIGLFNLSEIVRSAFQNAYASWAVGLPYTRQGIGREGLETLLDIAFSCDVGLGLHRVQANVITENVPSITLAQRVGFRREGYALRYLMIDGEWRDHAMYAMTVEDWSAAKSS